MKIRLNELEFVESNIGRLNCLIDLIPFDLCVPRHDAWDCLDPENCGLVDYDFYDGEFEGFCDNCREDMEHELQCRMDEFLL